jgi:hypothetical protein
MKVRELIELLNKVDGEFDVRILIESGFSSSSSDDVNVSWDDDEKVFVINGEEDSWE